MILTYHGLESTGLSNLAIFSLLIFQLVGLLYIVFGNYQPKTGYDNFLEQNQQAEDKV